MAVLRRLGHITDDKHAVMTQKGRAAAEIESVDELILAELLFDGMFLSLSPAQAVALCTCLFDMPKSKSIVNLDETMSKAYNKLQEAARRVCQVQNDNKIFVEEESYLAGFKPNLIPATMAWCSGKPFPEVSRLTDMFEGSVIRNFRRLDELLNMLMVSKCLRVCVKVCV